MSARTRWLVAGLAATVLAGGAVAGTGLLKGSGPPGYFKPDGCVLKALDLSVDLDPDQAGNAVTIAAAAARQGLPPQAVTIALAAALQESKLRNLSYGHLDSVGLFQQRPSQGWGTAEQISDPRYAATRFYRALARVRDWQALPIAEAAQQVQRSADGSAYAQWEPQARAMAFATTGQAAAGVACLYRRPAGDPTTLAAQVQTDFGPHALDRPVSPPARGWAIAGYLVANAPKYRVTQVNYLGRTWTASTGLWRDGGAVSPRVSFTLAPA